MFVWKWIQFDLSFFSNFILDIHNRLTVLTQFHAIIKQSFSLSFGFPSSPQLFVEFYRPAIVQQL